MYWRSVYYDYPKYSDFFSFSLFNQMLREYWTLLIDEEDALKLFKKLYSKEITLCLS